MSDIDNNRKYIENFETNWDKIDNDMVDFTLKECKERLKQTIQFNDSLHNKNFVLISIFISFITGLFGLLFYKIDVSQLATNDLYFILPIVFIIIGLCIGLYYSLSIIKFKKFHQVGNKPSTILNKKNLHDFLYLKECELMSYECRIDQNRLVNKMDGNKLNKAVWSLFLSFIASIVIVFIFLCCRIVCS